MKKLFPSGKSYSVYLIVATLVVVNLFTTPVYGQLPPETRRALNIGAPHLDAEEGITCSVSLGGAAGVVAKDFSLGEDPVERRVNLVSALMRDFGLTAEQASGPVGNFMWESGGDHLPPNINEGGNPGPPAFRGGYGWAQWTATRQTDFIDFAVANGYMESSQVEATDAANYAFLKHELTETMYSVTIDELKLQSTPESAAISFEDTFENARLPTLPERVPRARQAFEEHQARGGSTGSISNGSCQTGSAAIVGEYAFPLISNKSSISNNTIFASNTTGTASHPYTAYDILAPTGTPVVAFLSGVVTRITEDKCPGRMISIFNEESNLTISYLHLGFDNHVQKDDTVAAGDPVGFVGTLAEGCNVPHLHIDAATGNSRPGCSRESCPTKNQEKFVDIGPQLFETYQLLPE